MLVAPRAPHLFTVLHNGLWNNETTTPIQQYMVVHFAVAGFEYRQSHGFTGGVHGGAEGEGGDYRNFCVGVYRGWFEGEVRDWAGQGAGEHWKEEEEERLDHGRVTGRRFLL